MSDISKHPLWRQLLICIAHALLMLLLCWWWQTSSFTLAPEKEMVERSLSLKRKLLKSEEDTTVKFAFIDVSGAKKMIEREGRPGVEAITDRKMLADFFNLIAAIPDEKYQYIICDILFDQPSQDDTLLKNALGKISKIITPFTIEKGNIIPSVFSATETAYVGYDVSSGLFSNPAILKYPLVNDLLMKGLPVQLYERLENKHIEKALGLAWINGLPAVNNMLIDYTIRPVHLTENGNNKLIDLESILNLLKANNNLFFDTLLAGKIIVLGDFENDMHETALGNMAGPLILSNIYLSLKHGNGNLNLVFILYIFCCFIVTSKFLIYPPDWLTEFHKKIEDTPILSILFDKLICYPFLIWLIVSFIPLLITNFHINVGVLFFDVLIIVILKKYMASKDKKSENNQ